jgi:pilus assembly protein CpaB
MRAVSIAVSPTSGNAGFISPGDRVDLIVTHRIHVDGSTNNLTGTVISDTFIRDVRVLAVDQQLENADNQAILAKTVTVEVTPKQAEQITVATDLGKISVMLRSTSVAEEAAQQAASR